MSTSCLQVVSLPSTCREIVAKLSLIDAVCAFTLASTSCTDGVSLVFISGNLEVTLKAVKEAGRLRLEGKEYEMQDGDICYFRFNV